MCDGSIMELICTSNLDNEINNASLFKSDIEKHKYSKGDLLFYPQGQLNWGNTIKINIDKKGDLLYNLYIVVKLPKLSINNLILPNNNLNENNPNEIYRVKYVDFIGNILIEKVSLYINDKLIDEITSDFMQVYTDLYISDWNRKAMLGYDEILNKPNLKIDPDIIYIPLQFWFCKEQYNPLPIIALQYSDIYIDIKLRNFDECVSVLEIHNNILYHSLIKHKQVPIESLCLQANFYYVNLEKRQELAMKDYEILITQAQYKSINFKNKTHLDINFNYVVKDLIFYIQSSINIKNNEYFNFSNKLKIPSIDFKPINNTLWNLTPKRHLLKRARILFDGIERVEWRDVKYFYNMQNYENYKTFLDSYIYLYSFNISPKSTGNNVGCNFSRITNPQLQIELIDNPTNIYNIFNININDNYELKCIVNNYNILIIKNGLASLKFQ